MGAIKNLGMFFSPLDGDRTARAVRYSVLRTWIATRIAGPAPNLERDDCVPDLAAS
jgi:hypothetical protein